MHNEIESFHQRFPKNFLYENGNILLLMKMNYQTEERNWVGNDYSWRKTLSLPGQTLS